MSDAPFRVLPILTDENRFFWTSGADGVLRFLRCGGCGYYLHPPSPRCPRCGGTGLSPDAVSGRGVVHSFTVNHQSWDGSSEPYVIAVVELAEQSGLRLTTNIVGCAPEEVTIDASVHVAFEPHGGAHGSEPHGSEPNREVWFPVFELDANPDEGPDTGSAAR